MAREVIRVRDEFYIRSSSPRVDVRTRVLKQGGTFAVFDRFGDIETFGTGELGLYYQDLLLTRHDEGDVGVNVLRRDGEIEIVLLK
jgi:hypothetical protein